MKISNAYFKHPVTGEIIKPGEMYQDFDKGAFAINRMDINAEARLDEEPVKESTEDSKPLSELDITELKKLAKELKIVGYAKMDKGELIAAFEASLGKNPNSTENCIGEASNTNVSDTEVKDNDNSAAN